MTASALRFRPNGEISATSQSDKADHAMAAQARALPANRTAHQRLSKGRLGDPATPRGNSIAPTAEKCSGTSLTAGRAYPAIATMAT